MGGNTEASGDADGGALLSIVYASAATVRFSETDLAVLLAQSRLNNDRRGLTGLLLYRDGQFMQALEGPPAAVRALLGTITADPRHTGVWTLAEESITTRRFPTWSMGYQVVSDEDAGRLPAWFGSPEALEQRDASRADELLDWFRSR